MPYYAVAKGRNPGVYLTWPECKQQIHKYLFAKYRKFETEQEAISFVVEHQHPKHNNTQNDVDDDVIHDDDVSKPKSTKQTPSSRKKTEKVHCLMVPHEKTDLFVYTDGACSKNGSHHAKAGIGIYFGEGDKRNTSLRLLTTKQTNNVAELTSLNHAINIVLNDKDTKTKNITFVTDSKYSIQCLTTYGKKCAKNGWKTDIPNKELVMETYTLFNEHVTYVRLLHVMAHTGNNDMHSVGNHNADLLAVKAIT
jgi:ribonuclease HI